MAYVSMKQMLETGVHFGHQTRRWNPKMRPFIFGARNGIHIIDLQQTVKLYRTAHDKIVETVANGGRVLFIGTKRQAQEAVAAEAGRAGQFHVTNRWMGGTLTNFATIQKSIERLKKLEAMFADGSVNRYQKKEILTLQREMAKLELTLGGIKDMDRLPQLAFIIDPNREEIAVKECRKLGIPIVAVTDTNCDPDVIDYIIPGNDDAIRAIKLFVTAMAEACLEGEAMRKDSKNKDAEEELKKPRLKKPPLSKPPPNNQRFPEILMSITAAMVKDLREKTAAGMMDCKKALTECDGDMEKAVDWLRQKGLSKAAKKAGRATSEGLVGFELAADGKSGVAVEVKCETDFVARGDKFQGFVKDMVAQVAKGEYADSEALLSAPFVADASVTVKEALDGVIATTGENMGLGKFAKMELAAGKSGLIGGYLHSNGKLAVLVEMQTGSDAAAASEAFHEVAKNVAMQIAAASPLAVSAEGLNPEVVEHEREVYRQKAREEGKPEQIIEKIAEGAVKKFCKDVCLLDQLYIRDDKMTISDLIKGAAKTIGEPITVVRFVRIQLGAE